MGGLGTLLGPVVGAGVFIFVENFSSIYFPARWPLVLGGLFVLTIIFAREGLGVYLWRLWGRASHRHERIKS